MDLLVGRDGPLVTLTLYRPARRNALSDGLLRELEAALGALRDDRTVGAVILTGAPPAFSAGADAGLASRMTVEERREAFLAHRSDFARLFPRVLGLLEGLEVPTVAAVNGHAVGAGWVLALGCDFRVVAAGALFWIPEADLGIPLHPAFVTRFARLVGPAITAEIAMTGRRYGASAAQTLGLVHEVVADEAVAPAAAARARALAGKPARALAEVKARVDAVARAGLPEVSADGSGILHRPGA